MAESSSRPTASMSSLVVRNPDKNIWDSHRRVLEEKYVTKAWSLKKVMAYMEENHEFVAKKNQYEKYLVHKWKLRKHTDSSKWKAALPVIRRLQQEEQPFELWIDGDKKSESAILKELNRYPASDGIGPSRTLKCELPREVIIRKLTPSTAPSSTIELPFSCLEHYDCMQYPSSSLWILADTNNFMSRDDSGSLATWGLDRSTQKALSSVMLSESAVNRPFNSLVMRPIYRRFLFSFANNFAGNASLPKEKVLGYLQRETSEDLYRIIRCAPEYYTTRAIARNLFQASIDVGNAQIVEFLLRESFPDVQANSCISSCMNSDRTPIEEAAALMQTKVVKVLLQHGADVDPSRLGDDRFSGLRIYEFGPIRGALNCLVRGSYLVDEIDPELFSVLVNAGGKMDDFTLEHLIENDRKGRFVPLIFSKHISESHKRWNETGIFLKVFRYHHMETSSEILKLMLINSVDLNYQVNFNRNGRSWKTPIDEAAFHGDPVLVDNLVRNGARVTADTLPCAIKSGNEDLVKLLFKFGARADSKGWSEQSALATALSVQNTSMIELVVGLQGLGFLEDPEHLQEVIKASVQNRKVMELVVGQQVLRFLEDPAHLQIAIKVACIFGDIPRIEYLAKQGGVLNSEDLRFGLTIAIIYGETEVALALLDAGADLGGGEYFWARACKEDFRGPPLAYALKCGNAKLVFALLDAGADPNYHSSESVELAVRFGDPDIVHALIEAGAHSVICTKENRVALTTAIKCRNKDLAFMLLHAGYDIKHKSVFGSDETTLTTAVGTEDLDMVHFVMELGADPHDPDALHLAWNQKSAAFDLILQKHALRYPKGRKGWGAAILKQVIDCDDFKSFQQIIKRGADANYHPRRGSPERGYDVDRETTCFGYAITESDDTRIKFVEFLLQQQQISGCAPDIVVKWLQDHFVTSRVMHTRYTAFLVAIETGDLPTIELFLRHGANVNYPARNSIKRTPLQRAAEIGNTEVVDLLLKRGADPNGPAAHEMGGTALQLASIGGYLRIAQLLLENGADVNAPASKLRGRTPLEGAAEHGRLDMVAYLLKAGAGQNGKDKKDFHRAMGYAEKNGYLYIADLLKQYLATGKLSAPQSLFDEFLNPDMMG